MNASPVLDRLRLVTDIPRYYLRAATAFGFHPVAAARRMAVALGDRYRPPEAFALGLLSTDARFYAPRMYVSKSEMAQVQQRLNPRSLEWLFSDRGMFHRFCAAGGIAVPELYGILLPASAGWAAPDTVLSGRDATIAFLKQRLPSAFMVTPARPACRSGGAIIHHKGDRFTGLGPDMMDAEELLDRLTARNACGGWVFQERLRNHATLAVLNGTSGLQTVRLMTLADREGCVSAIGAFSRLVVGKNRIDSDAKGTTGDILAEISLKDGRITRGFTFSRSGRGAVTVHTHPLTAHRIAGVQLPFWQEALALVSAAGSRFLPVRTVGWDVALTDRGPVLVEGNLLYDPPCHIEDFLAVFDESDLRGRL